MNVKNVNTRGEGLRSRKKRETRQRISDIATALFIERGFDQVTVADVADAAGVSKVTVFNYFPHKEQLFFDRGDEAIALLRGALRSRRPGESIPEAIRGLILDLAAQRHPLSALRDGVQAFWLVVAASPTLMAGARAEVDALEADVASVIAADAGMPEGFPGPRLLAAFLIAACRVIYLYAARRLLAGDSADTIHTDYVALVNQAFDMIGGATAPLAGRSPALG
jgi:AcrR family transcriptional regulator